VGNTRAIVGSFGAGASLAIASSLILLIVSSVVAFRGWPDDLSGSSSQPSIAQLADSGSGPGTTAPAAKDAAVALPAAPTIQTLTRKQRHAAGAPASGDTVAGSGGGSSSSGTTTGSSAGGGSGPAADTGQDPQVSGAVHAAGDAVGTATKGSGDAVTPAAPVLGRTLETVGASGAAATDQAGDAAGVVAGSVLP
jgi:hypothetical protein